MFTDIECTFTDGKRTIKFTVNGDVRTLGETLQSALKNLGMQITSMEIKDA